MHVLAIDVGSSSVKMGVLRDGRVIGKISREIFRTRYGENRAEIDPNEILKAIARAAHQLNAKKIDCIALSAMGPSWLAMDKHGKPLTPIVTHQDRRSIAIAEQIEKCVGKKRHLHLCGNRPVPGGISSTTCAWFLKNEPSIMRRADLVGHLNTFLHRQFCGVRVTDPSHASFMGLYSTLTLVGWNDELCSAIGISQKLLPEIRESNEIAGRLSPEAARLLGVKTGTPMFVGMLDTGAAMLLAGAKIGQMVNVIGSTDVLGLCTDDPKPNEKLLTRALGIGRKWMSVGTIAAAGSSLKWAKDQLFSEMKSGKFFQLVAMLAKDRKASGGVEFEPYLVGDRASVEQREGQFSGLTLASTREQMLAAIVEALARVSAERIEILQSTGTKMSHKVMISGGGGDDLAKIMHRDWPGKWKFWSEEEATLRGLARLVPSPFGRGLG
jgi:xylulokinase